MDPIWNIDLGLCYPFIKLSNNKFLKLAYSLTHFLHPQKLIRAGKFHQILKLCATKFSLVGVIMLVWCLLLVGAVSAVQGEEASSGGLAPPPVQPWGVNAYNLGGFGPGSSGSFDGAEGGDFGGGLGGPFFGPSTMPGFSPGDII